MATAMRRVHRGIRIALRVRTARRNGSSIQRFESVRDDDRDHERSTMTSAWLGMPVMYGVNMMIGQCQR